LKKEKIDSALKNKKSPTPPKALKFPLFQPIRLRRIAKRKTPPRICGAGQSPRLNHFPPTGGTTKMSSYR